MTTLSHVFILGKDRPLWSAVRLGEARSIEQALELVQRARYVPLDGALARTFDARRGSAYVEYPHDGKGAFVIAVALPAEPKVAKPRSNLPDSPEARALHAKMLEKRREGRKRAKMALLAAEHDEKRRERRAERRAVRQEAEAPVRT